MKEIVINDNNLKDNQINEVRNKVRSILLFDNKILISKYAGMIFLPGGSIDNEETTDQAIIRELSEETGIAYDINELDKLFSIKYYQYNYPTRDKGIMNRLVNTNYYFGEYKGIDINNVNLTENEINGGFNLELMDIDSILEFINKKTDNPRKEFFDNENSIVIKELKLMKKIKTIK